MASTTSTVLNNLVANYFVDKALLTLVKKTPLYDLAMKTDQVPGRGGTTYWNAWIRIAGASSALAEGGSNTAVAASSRRVSATVAQYGRAVTITDLAEFESSLPARDGVRERLSKSASETWELICHTGIFKAAYYGSQSTTGIMSALMSSLASAQCANTGTNNNSNKLFQFPVVYGTSCGRLSAVSKTAPSISSKASLLAVMKATRRLRVMDAEPYADGKFVGYAHPNFIHILKLATWNSSQNSVKTMWAGEVGDTDQVRWVMSSLCPRYAVAAHSVNLTFISGRDAFGVTTALKGLEMYLITGPDSNNLFNTLTTLSYKITAAAACLNPSAGVILATHELL